MSTKKFFLLSSLAIGFAACSSNEEDEEMTESSNSLDESANTSGGQAPPTNQASEPGAEPDASSLTPPASPAASSGLLTFSEGSDKGVVAKGVKWGKPITSENPGADCELRQRKAKDFVCVIKDGGVSNVLTLVEGKNGGLTKIFLDGKTAKTRDRWIGELKAMGFKQSGITESSKLTKTQLLAPDQKTKAEVVWVAPKDAVTVILKP